MTPKLTVQHGEAGSVFYIVDADAPESEQPCILGAYNQRANAEQALLGAIIFGARYFALGSPTEKFTD